MQVAVFIPCYIHQLKPQIGIKMIRVLELLGFNVRVDTEALCCGQPAYNAGYHQEAKKVATKFFNVYQNDKVIIVPSASCAGFLKNYTPSLFKEECEEDATIIKNVQNGVVEFADFIAKNASVRTLNISYPHELAYHSSCAAIREYSCINSTLQVLNDIKGIELIPFEYSETCCGFGGSFADKYADISISMAQHKLEMLHKKHITKVVSNDYSCLLHLESVAQKNAINIQFLHLADVLDQSL